MVSPSVAGAESAPNVLSLIDSARGCALGGAVAAAEGDATLAWHNPSVSAVTGHRWVTLAGQRGFIEDTTWQVLGAFPVGKRAGAAVGVSYYDAGTVTAGDGSGRRISAQQDMMGMVNGSFAVAEWARAGVSVKGMRTKLVDEFSSGVAAFDAGGVVAPDESLRLGVMLLNAGRAVHYREKRVPLATELRAGVATRQDVSQPGGEEPGELALFVDAGYPLEEKAVEWHFGLEYRWRGALDLRAGLSRRRRQNPWAYSGGVGLKIRRYRVDYATKVESASGFPQVFSFTVGF